MKSFYAGMASAASLAVIASASAVSMPVQSTSGSTVATVTHNHPHAQVADDGHMHPKEQNG